MIELIKTQLQELQEKQLLQAQLEHLKALCQDLLRWRKELKESKDDAEKRHIIDGYAATMKELEKYFENKLA